MEITERQLPYVLILGLMIFSLLFNGIYGASSEISVIVKVVDVEKYKGQTWNINAQLRDSTNDSELAKDKTTFKVNENQTIQLVLESNNTKNINNSYIFIDASSTLDDIDVFGKIESPKKENNFITLNLTKAG